MLARFDRIRRPITQAAAVSRITYEAIEDAARALDELWPVYGIAYAPERLDLDNVFGRSADKSGLVELKELVEKGA